MADMALAERVAAFAAGKNHKLAPFQVDGQHPVTPQAAAGLMRYLSRCPDKTAVEQPMNRPTPNPAPAAPETRKQARFQDIPAGFYATRQHPEGGQADFWKVSVGRRGERRYVKRVVGGGSAQQPELIDIAWPQMTAALKAVLAGGIPESAALYAELETRCTACGRQLTDEVSIEAGMGPTCREKGQ